MKLGVVGLGYVGKAVRNAFAPYHEMRCYDVVPERSTHSIDEVRDCDVIFVCVPTPSAPDGSCDVSAVDSALASLAGLDTPIILKSTVPVGTTEAMVYRHDLAYLMFWPEFLDQRTADADCAAPKKLVISPAANDVTSNQDVLDLFKSRWPGVPLFEVDTETAEFSKYLCNCFYAVKVAFFNEMYEIAAKHGVNWQDALRIALADGRISPSHTQVPGPSGEKGFGGCCLPKDIAAMIRDAQSVGVEPHVLKGAVVRNDIQRGKA